MDALGMKMIWAVIRPEVVDTVVKALTAGGYPAMTRFDVYGRGKQKGVVVGGENYDMPKTVLMLVVEASSTAGAVKIIEDNARTRSIGDGRIFVAPIEEAHTIRTGELGL
ncbi:MAG: P-II family nitrogen regulator [Methanothrix sp.]|jgi:nitrogen regulatory protein PII 1|nr:P-II family nitrogen regulator [Methanothrix sp.]